MRALPRVLGTVAAAAVAHSPPAVGPSTLVTATIRAPIEQVFAYTVAEDVLPKVLKRYGPIPSIAGTKILHGPWERVGADRRVLMAGGGSLHEQITAFERPGSFTYQVDDFQDTPLRALARRGVGNFTFREVGGATQVDWTYSFEPKSALTHPLLSVFVGTLYRGFMQQALGRIRANVERAAAASTFSDSP
jgi:hypothetical protein